jgi:hypothetical protein
LIGRFKRNTAKNNNYIFCGTGASKFFTTRMHKNVKGEGMQLLCLDHQKPKYLPAMYRPRAAHTDPHNRIMIFF